MGLDPVILCTRINMEFHTSTHLPFLLPTVVPSDSELLPQIFSLRRMLQDKIMSNLKHGFTIPSRHNEEEKLDKITQKV